MKKNMNCPNCSTENIIIEYNLFFSEEKKDQNILCSKCKNLLFVGQTDGWYFVQSVEDYKLNEIIESQNEKIVYV